jgi:hypothetical protein
MIKLIRATMALFVPLISLTAFCYGADVSGNLSVNVVSPEAIPKLRGRPHIANGTLVADNGAILRGVHMHPDPGAGGLFSQWYDSLSWWQNLHDIGHFNVVRAGARDDVVSIANIESAYDTMVSLAAQTGIYVIVGSAYGAGSKTNCPSLARLQSFWSAIAPRYANNTNVIYEIFNESDFCFSESALSNMETTLYNQIRAAAPNTPILTFSFSRMDNLNTNDGNALNLVRGASGISYTNAVVGWHGYDDNCPSISSMQNGDRQMQGAGYPTFMDEVDNEVCGGNGGFSAGFPLIANYVEPHGESWVWLDADGFLNCADGITYGNASRNPQCLNVTWPRD